MKVKFTKKLILFVVIVIATSMLLSSCGSKTLTDRNTSATSTIQTASAPDITSTSAGSPDNESTQVFTFHVNTSMPLYQCTAAISGREDKQTNQIVITDAGNGTLIQTIVPQKNEMATKSAVYFFDVTFDGNLDLLIPLERSAHYITFDAFIWDKTNKKFVEAPSFQNIWNPSIDTAGKQILAKDSSDRMTSYAMIAYEDDRFVTTNSLSWKPADLEPNPVSNAANLAHFIETKGEAGHETTINDFYVPMVNGDIDRNDPKLKPYFAPGSFWDLGNQKWKSTFLNELKSN